ncbi:GGDEF domain-containing protein [Angustibacter peucedani]
MRPLAADEHRARFWVRHVRIGVAQSELAAVVAIVYAVVRGPHTDLVTVGVAALTMAVSPLLLLVPIDRWSRDRRGSAFFYSWSVATTLVIAVAMVRDGGSTSPLAWLLVLTLAFAGLAYPALGVLVMGAFMIGTYLVTVSITEAQVSHSLVTATILGLFTLMIAWVSSNQWQMSERQHALAQRLAVLADTDDLTSLLNRRAFGARVQTAVDAATPEAPVSVLVLDLDGFKAVNDARGHAEGDRVLVDVAGALRAVTGPDDAAARLGGDEFALLLTASPDADARARAEQVSGLVATGRSSRQVGASIGCVTTSEPCGVEELLARADAAMYAIKPGRRSAPAAQPVTA